MEIERVEQDLALTECQGELKASGDQLVQAEVKLVELQTCLAMVNEMRSAAEVEFETANAKRELAELYSYSRSRERSKLCFQKLVVWRKRSEYRRFCRRKLWPSVGIYRILRMKCQVDIGNAAILNGDCKLNQDSNLGEWPLVMLQLLQHGVLPLTFQSREHNLWPTHKCLYPRKPYAVELLPENPPQGRVCLVS